MVFIAVVNRSTRLAEADLALAVRAVSLQLRYHVAPAWGTKAVSVVHFTPDAGIPAGAYVITMYDDADQADALGYHTEDPDGTVYGKVFVSPVLDNGGSPLVGSLSVSAVLSHEVLETYIDPHVQLWASNGSSAFYAYEICDAVEDLSYPVTVSGQQISVSDFVNPSYFDTQAKDVSRLDYMATLTQPLEISSGGYAVRLTLGTSDKIEQVFGETFPEWKKAAKTHKLSRFSRRLGTSEPAVTVQNPTYPASITRIIDGDTLDAQLTLSATLKTPVGLDTVLTNTATQNITVRLRLLGVDAPQGGTPEGDAAALFVQDWTALHAGPYTVATQPGDAKDEYGRYLATVTAADQAVLNTDLVSSGHAVLCDGASD